MLALAYYLLKVVVCSGLLFGYYLIALRNKRFHQHNRFYLLIISLLSWVIPLFKIEFWQEPASGEAVPLKLLTMISSADAMVAESAIQTESAFGLEQVMLLLYFLISLVFLVSMLSGLYNIFRIIRSNPKKVWQNITLVFTKNDRSPFSFFRFIFWNNNLEIETTEGKNILEHELAHVREWHSLDKLYITLLLVVGWFNPFFWLIKKELNMIHEFIADRKAVSNGDVTALAEMLLRSAYPTHSFAMSNSFFHSPIKRRIMMLTNLNSPKYSYLRRLLILPLLAFVIVLFAFKTKQVIKAENKFQPKIENVQLPNDTEIISDQLTIAEILSDKNNNGEKVLLSENSSQYEDDLQDSANKNKPIVVVDGKDPITYAEFEKLDIKPDQIRSINVLKGEAAKALYGEKGNAGVIEIFTKEKASTENKIEFDKVFTSVENPPYYRAGMVDFAKFIQANLSYPKEALEKNVEGAVTIQFIVDENGSLSNFKKLSSKGYGLEEEAIRVLQLSGEWQPGMQNGRKVPVQLEQQIIFSIPEIPKRMASLSEIDGKLLWPVDNAIIAIPFGKYTMNKSGKNSTTKNNGKLIGTSDGITIKVEKGAKVKASAAGNVASIVDIGDTKAIIINHGSYYTGYSNLINPAVNRGDEVKAGSIIGFVAENIDDKTVGELIFMVTDNAGKLYDPQKTLVKK